VKTGTGVRQGHSLSLILLNLYHEYLTNEAPKGFGDFKIGGQVICTVNYADDLVLLAKEEMINRLHEIRRYNELEMNVEKITRSIKQYPLQIMVVKKQLENVEYLN
jgi:hypothetical protein